MIFFGNRLLRGNRTTKQSTNKFVAFNTPNQGYLGEVGVNFIIHWEKVLTNIVNTETFEIFSDMSQDISTINISPCINLKVVQAILENSKAVIVQAYGMGNIPSKNK